MSSKQAKKSKETADAKESQYQIIYDREECIGAGSCTAVSKNWKMADDGHADPLKKDLSEEDLKENLEAAEVCPVHCIHIIHKKTGKKLI